MNLKDLNLSTPITKNVSVSNRTYIVEEAINTERLLEEVNQKLALIDTNNDMIAYIAEDLQLSQEGVKETLTKLAGKLKTKLKKLLTTIAIKFGGGFKDHRDIVITIRENIDVDKTVYVDGNDKGDYLADYYSCIGLETDVFMRLDDIVMYVLKSVDEGNVKLIEAIGENKTKEFKNSLTNNEDLVNADHILNPFGFNITLIEDGVIKTVDIPDNVFRETDGKSSRDGRDFDLTLDLVLEVGGRLTTEFKNLTAAYKKAEKTADDLDLLEKVYVISLKNMLSKEEAINTVTDFYASAYN